VLDPKKVSKSVCDIETQICYIHGLLAAEEQGAPTVQTGNKRYVAALDDIRTIVFGRDYSYIKLRKVQNLITRLNLTKR
jgi:hypothetical protein